MAEAVVLILEEARRRRSLAARARQLALQLNDAEAIANLLAFATGIERHAAELEARAAALRESTNRSTKLASEITTKLSETQSQLDDLRGKIVRLDTIGRTEDCDK